MNAPSRATLALVACLTAASLGAARADDGRYGPDYGSNNNPNYNSNAQPSYPTQNQPDQPSAWQRRGKERLFEAKVTETRAVVGTPERRCWVEREEMPNERSSTKVPAAVGGAVEGINRTVC